MRTSMSVYAVERRFRPFKASGLTFSRDLSRGRLEFIDIKMKILLHSLIFSFSFSRDFGEMSRKGAKNWEPPISPKILGTKTC